MPKLQPRPRLKLRLNPRRRSLQSRPLTFRSRLARLLSRPRPFQRRQYRLPRLPRLLRLRLLRPSRPRLLVGLDKAGTDAWTM